MNTSFEFFPPKTDQGKANLLKTTEKLIKFSPEYFSVTYGAGGSTRDGTLEACVSIKNSGAQALPHLSGIGASKDLIKEVLAQYKANGLNRIVALRGDLPSGIGGLGDFPYALDLIKFIKTIEEDMSIEVAAYPEVHPDAESEDSDFKNFLDKVKAGADGAITQFFFEESVYFDFMEKCEKGKVLIPVTPGIMPIHDFEALTRMAKNCSANIPKWLKEGMEQYSNTRDQVKYGIEVIINLCERLIKYGVPGIHFYTVNREEPTSIIIRNLGI